MANINETKFWTDLLKKIVAIVLRRAAPDSRPVVKNQHVVPHEDRWAVKGAGNKTVTDVFDRQEQAISRARKLARKYGTDVIVHRKDGSIRDRFTP